MRQDVDDPRRKLLVRSLSLRLFAGANLASLFQPGHALGDAPEKLPDASINLATKYHDEPYYVLPAAASSGKLNLPAPVINHTDAELTLIEELIGRRPPFDFPGGGYQ